LYPAQGGGEVEGGAAASRALSAAAGPRAARPKAGPGCAESGRLKKILEGVQ